MSAELRAAAEMIVRGITKREEVNSRGYAVNNPGEFLMGLMEPYELAAAYLADNHADDDEPAAPCNKAIREFPDGINLCLRWNSDGLFIAMGGKFNGAMSGKLQGAPTNRDVRRLCKALGIELREQP